MTVEGSVATDHSAWKVSSLTSTSGWVRGRDEGAGMGERDGGVEEYEPHNYPHQREPGEAAEALHLVGDGSCSGADPAHESCQQLHTAVSWPPSARMIPQVLTGR